MAEEAYAPTAEQLRAIAQESNNNNSEDDDDSGKIILKPGDEYIGGLGRVEPKLEEQIDNDDLLQVRKTNFIHNLC